VSLESTCCRATPCCLETCRLCLPCGLMVADVVAAYPEGLTHAQVSALLCVSETHARRLESQAMARTEKALVKERAKRGITKSYGSLA
jgi:hypothetical protein